MQVCVVIHTKWESSCNELKILGLVYETPNISTVTFSFKFLIIKSPN